MRSTREHYVTNEWPRCHGCRRCCDFCLCDRQKTDGLSPFGLLTFFCNTTFFFVGRVLNGLALLCSDGARRGEGGEHGLPSSKEYRRCRRMSFVLFSGLANAGISSRRWYSSIFVCVTSSSAEFYALSLLLLLLLLLLWLPCVWCARRYSISKSAKIHFSSVAFTREAGDGGFRGGPEELIGRHKEGREDREG